MNEKADERVLNAAQLVVKWTLASSWPFEVCSADEWDVRGARLEHSHVHLISEYAHHVIGQAGHHGRREIVDTNTLLVPDGLCKRDLK